MPDERIRVGAVDVLGVPDAAVDPSPWPLSMRFPRTPLEAFEPYRRRYPRAFSQVGGPDATPSTFTCYVLRSRGRTILVDTGIGPAGAPIAGAVQQAGDLPGRLRARGVDPAAVDVVVLTHLHPDHIGWNVRPEQGQPRLTFPRARYLVHQADWEAWHRPEVQAVFPGFDELIRPLADLGALELTEGERSVTEELSTLHTPGHTPGSQSVLVTSGSDRALIVGDAFSHPVQVTEPDWPYSFDMDTALAARTRQGLLERLEAEGATFAASHFPAPGFGTVVRLERRRYWQAL